MRALSERVTEDSVEDYLVAQVEQRKGRTIKLRMLRGWPDRVVLLPGGLVLFVECKRPKGGVYEPLQLRIHDWLRKNGFRVYLVRNRGEIDTMFRKLYVAS